MENKKTKGYNMIMTNFNKAAGTAKGKRYGKQIIKLPA